MMVSIVLGSAGSLDLCVGASNPKSVIGVERRDASLSSDM